MQSPDNYIYQNTNFSILIKETEFEYIFKKWNSFIIPKVGIYTIEGPNRSGKSILIKMIMGVLPPAIEGENEKSVFINGISKNIASVNDAYANGLVAVFQDDSLIPTMTIREQIYLRHAPKHTFLNYIGWLPLIASKIFLNLVEHTLGFLIKSEFLKRLEPRKELYMPETILEPIIKKWLKKFELTDDILDKYPIQLSGGTIAKIRIINALMTKECKILFLDEALNAVSATDCNNIIDILKNWSTVEDKTIIIVTHKKNEILRWQPDKRFEIKDRSISIIDDFNSNGLCSGVFTEHTFITRFDSIQSSREQLIKLQRPLLVLIDKKLSDHETVNELLELLNITGKGREHGFYKIDIKEESKSLELFNKNITSIISFLPKAEGTIILIGGGTLINFGLFISSVLHRGLLKPIIFPTTLMALADVAVGSKASLNITIDIDELYFKHVIGTYLNPSIVINELKFIDTLKSEERFKGLSECLKHGLLQDIEIYSTTIKLLKQRNPETKDCFDLGILVQELKSRTLNVDPFEKDYGRILLYGHLHAHCFERLSAFKLDHGIAVFLGILIDLNLCNNVKIFNDILKIIIDCAQLYGYISTFLAENLSDPKSYQKLKIIYNTESKTQHYQSRNFFRIIKLSEIGQYSTIPMPIEDIFVSWEEIESSIKLITSKIYHYGRAYSKSKLT